MLKRVISTEKIPVKLWLDDLEAGAEVQARNVANLPFAFRHVAIMPDGHQGYGMPIGGVLAAQAERRGEAGKPRPYPCARGNAPARVAVLQERP